MGFKRPYVTVIAGIVAAGIALIFQIIAVASNGWIKDGDGEAGLWKFCILGQCTEYPSDSVDDWLKATRAFGLLGLMFIAGAVVVEIVSMFIDNRSLPRIASSLAGIAALFVLISFAVFAAKTEFRSFLSYSFALSVVAFILCIGSSVCFLIPSFRGNASS